MLFVPGIELVAVGIGATTYTRTETRYARARGGSQIPYEVTVHPYLELGLLMDGLGAFVIIVAWVKTMMTVQRTRRNHPPPPSLAT